MITELNNFGVPISYIHPKTAWKPKQSVTEPLCLSDWIIVIIYSVLSDFTFFCSCVCGCNWE